MTDRLAGLTALSSRSNMAATPEMWQQALAEFHTAASGDALVLDKWFRVQAGSDGEGVLEQVEALTGHPDWSISNPNKVRALFGAFIRNIRHFHSSDGKGYAFIGSKIQELSRSNPQIAAGLTRLAFSQWDKYTEDRKVLMQRELEAILAIEGLSKDVYEIAAKSLAR